MMPFELLPEAALEIREGIEYFDKEPPGKGVEFREAVYETIAFLRRFPKIGRARSCGARTRRVSGFEYMIAYEIFDSFIYVDRPNEVIVVAFAHDHRKPGYWKKRLK